MAFDASATSSGVERTTDASRVNAFVNHPDVRPYIGEPDAGELDLAPFLADPSNVALSAEHGCFMFAPLEPGQYELHTAITPEGRGAGVLPAASAAFRWMFVQTDCVEIVTKVPEANRRARLMAARAGFQRRFERQAAWHDGSAVTYFALTLEAWRATDPAALAAGKAFHDSLEAAKQASGSTLATHPDDEAHDRAAGAAVLMARAGNATKAADTYNRWARFAGYEPVRIVPAPTIFDIGDAVVTFAPDLRVLACR